MLHASCKWTDIPGSLCFRNIWQKCRICQLRLAGGCTEPPVWPLAECEQVIFPPVLKSSVLALTLLLYYSFVNKVLEAQNLDVHRESLQAFSRALHKESSPILVFHSSALNSIPQHISLIWIFSCLIRWFGLISSFGKIKYFLW